VFPERPTGEPKVPGTFRFNANSRYHLRELERDGTVARQIFNEMPLRVEYSLTKYGQTLRPLLRALCHWGSRHEDYVARNGERIAPPRILQAAHPKRMVIAIG